jgi:uncharacterized protein (DUF362 family)
VAEHDRHFRSNSGGSLERRDFLKKAGKWGGALLLALYGGTVASCAKKIATPAASATAPATSPPPPASSGGGADLSIAQGGDPGDMARRAVQALGGMGRFVKAGNTVVIKPNASFPDGIAAGTATNPGIVAVVVSMCKEAGAGRVVVMDHCLRGVASQTMEANGITQAAKAAGAEVLSYGAADTSGGVLATVPGGTKTVSVYPEAIKADVLITVPKAKHHGSAGLSLGMKNLIGLTTSMSRVHDGDLNQGIADLAAIFKPKLSVVDATVVLTTNGPGGPGATMSPNMVIASPDFVAADSFACSIFGKTAADVGYVSRAAAMGLGQADYRALKTAKV